MKRIEIMLLQKKYGFAYSECSQAAFSVFKHFCSLYQQNANLCLKLFLSSSHAYTRTYMNACTWFYGGTVIQCLFPLVYSVRNGQCSVSDISNWVSLTVISPFHWYIWLCIITKINKLTNSRHQFLSLWSIGSWKHSLFPCARGDYGAVFMDSLPCIIIFIKQCHSHSQIWPLVCPSFSSIHPF